MVRGILGNVDGLGGQPRVPLCMVKFNNKEVKFQFTLNFHPTYNLKFTWSLSLAKKIPNLIFTQGSRNGKRKENQERPMSKTYHQKYNSYILLYNSVCAVRLPNQVRGEQSNYMLCATIVYHFESDPVSLVRMFLYKLRLCQRQGGTKSRVKTYATRVQDGTKAYICSCIML